MPLFELYRMTKEKLDSATEKKNPTTTATDLSLEFVEMIMCRPENDHLAELVWENGQILMQGQSSRTRKTPASNSLPSHCLPSQTVKTRDKDVGNGSNIKMGKFGTMDSMLNEIPVSVPSDDMGLNQDDDMVPWLNYPIVESLQSEYCSEFLPELSGVTANELSSQNNFASFVKRSCGDNQFNRGLNSVCNDVSLEQGSGSKISPVGGSEAARHKSGTSQLYSSSAQHCQTSFPYLRSRVSDTDGNSMTNSTHHGGVGDSAPPTSAGSFVGLKMQKQDTKMPTVGTGLMNFSHFSRPAAIVKANLQSIGLTPGSNFSRTGRMASKDKGSVPSCSNHVESTLIDSNSGLRKETSSHGQPVVVPSKTDVKLLDTKPPEELPASELPRAISDEDAFKNDKTANQTLDESTNKRLPDGEKTTEPVVASSSSACSGNSVERASDDPARDLKRKHQDVEDSECPSEDVEEESMGTKKAVPARIGSGSKRSRAAEVHNLSERRRRDRINEKMRALQELIPNCNKVDKASMLDEAIEYLKTLQLQVQIMSMGTGFYMPPMMFPAGMQHMHAAHMAHFPPMGVGMGMGLGFGMGMPDMNGGSSGCPIVQVPQMHGAHFPGPPVSGPTALHGMAVSNYQLFGLPGQGHPISMPHAPVIPLSGGPIMKSSVGLNACGMVGPVENMVSAPGSSSKDPMQNINSQPIKNAGANSSTDQTSTQPAALQDNCQTSEASGFGTLMSPNKNDRVPNGADCKL